jgi:hypothetical protein
MSKQLFTTSEEGTIKEVRVPTLDTIIYNLPKEMRPCGL